MVSSVAQRGGCCRRRCRRRQHPSREARRVVVEGGIGIGRLLLCLRIPSDHHLLLCRQRPSDAKTQHCPRPRHAHKSSVGIEGGELKLDRRPMAAAITPANSASSPLQFYVGLQFGHCVGEWGATSALDCGGRARDFGGGWATAAGDGGLGGKASGMWAWRLCQYLQWRRGWRVESPDSTAALRWHQHLGEPRLVGGIAE